MDRSYTYTTGSGTFPDIYVSACGINAMYHIAYAGLTFFVKWLSRVFQKNGCVYRAAFVHGTLVQFYYFSNNKIPQLNSG